MPPFWHLNAEKLVKFHHKAKIAFDSKLSLHQRSRAIQFPAAYGQPDL
jgi:hypothetical protein